MTTPPVTGGPMETKWVRFLFDHTVGMKKYRPGDVAELVARDAAIVVNFGAAEYTDIPEPDKKIASEPSMQEPEHLEENEHSRKRGRK